VWRARRDGRGGDVDLSLFEVALAQLAYLGTWVASRGYVPVRREHSAHQTMVPFQNFPTKDGWLVVACPKQSLWERLCTAIGRPELADDERYRTFALRNENRAELLAVLEAEFTARATAEWLEVLGAAGVPAAPVNDVAAALADVQVAARHAVVESDHPVLGTVRQVATPLRLDAYEPAANRGPFRGEHTAEVLRELCGYDVALVGALEREGVFGAPAVAAEVAP
jgi:crotonobetainyl-CoA:carnitine CoA-transferase CaiB-like acyl-CoA transferase